MSSLDFAFRDYAIFSLKCNTHTLHTHILGAQLGGFLRVNTALPPGRRATQNTTRSHQASVTPPSRPPQVDRTRRHHGVRSLSAYTSESASVPLCAACSAQHRPLRLLRTEARGAAAVSLPAVQTLLLQPRRVVPGSGCCRPHAQPSTRRSEEASMHSFWMLARDTARLFRV